MSLISDRRCWPEARMSRRYSVCFSFVSPNIPCSSTSENPMIALSGVRSSCDMLARNSDLCWLATSSSRLFISISRKSRAFWMARADWVAKVLSTLDDLGRERPRRAAAHDQPADDALFTQERDGEQGARAGAKQGGAKPAVVRAVDRDVRDLDRLPRGARHCRRRLRPAADATCAGAARTSSSTLLDTRSSNASARSSYS